MRQAAKSIVVARLPHRCIIQVCICLVTLVDVMPCSSLIVAYFLLFHANKVMRKE